MIANGPEPVYSAEEIKTLEEMQKTLASLYRKSAKVAVGNGEYETSDWEKASSVANFRTAAGSCAAGYAAVTEILRTVKPSSTSKEPQP